MEDEEPKAEGGDHMIEGAEAVDSPESAEREPGHDRGPHGRPWECHGRSPPSAPVEKGEGRKVNPSRQ